jgi:hypothetical protein
MKIEAKLTWRPCAWLKTSFNYKYETTEFQTATDPASMNVLGDLSPGGSPEPAHYDAHRYSVNATLTPWRRLYLSGTFSYQDTRLEAFDNNSTSIVPYRGDIYSIMANATYALNEKTDLNASYSFSRADFGQDNFADGLPVGIRYQQHAFQPASRGTSTKIFPRNCNMAFIIMANRAVAMRTITPPMRSSRRWLFGFLDVARLKQ